MLFPPSPSCSVRSEISSRWKEYCISTYFLIFSSLKDYVSTVLSINSTSSTTTLQTNHKVFSIFTFISYNNLFKDSFQVYLGDFYFLSSWSPGDLKILHRNSSAWKVQYSDIWLPSESLLAQPVSLRTSASTLPGPKSIFFSCKQILGSQVIKKIFFKINPKSRTMFGYFIKVSLFLVQGCCSCVRPLQVHHKIFNLILESVFGLFKRWTFRIYCFNSFFSLLQPLSQFLPVLENRTILRKIISFAHPKRNR